MGEPSQEEKLLERALRALEEGNKPLYESLTKQAQRVHEDRLEAAAEAAVKADDNARNAARKKQKELLESNAEVILESAKVAKMRRNRNAATTPNEISRREEKFKQLRAKEAAENDRTGREKNAENEHKRTNPLSRLYSRLKTRYNKYTKNAKNKKNAHNKLVAARRKLYKELNNVQSKGIKRERGNNNNQGGGTRRRRRA